MKQFGAVILEKCDKTVELGASKYSYMKDQGTPQSHLIALQMRKPYANYEEN